MMNRNILKMGVVLPVALLAATVAGCATPGLGGSDYSRGQVRGEQSVRLGVVEQVRPVKIDGTRTGTGAAAGAVLGGVGGSAAGGGRGQVATTVAGAIVGGIIGQAAENSATSKEGVEVTIHLESGKLIAVTQEADEIFQVGDRVRVLSGGGVTRVSH